QTDKLTILAKEAASQKGCSRGECSAFIERVTRTCVELVGELGGSSLCDIAAAVPDSTTIAAEQGSEGQRDTEDELNNSMVPDQENESGPVREKRTRFQVDRTQVDSTVHSRSPSKRRRGGPAPR
uniref:Uncharacterized protein n=1 Tax=Aegilops tauschii subsp. strangulata TaxID=200361 RepID=A0A453E3C5_AEGTS